MDTKYQKGKIYKITNATNESIYIGSTICTLNKRFAIHNSDYRAYNNNNKERYCSSSQILGLENPKIELVEAFSCETKEQLREREQYHINLNKNVCVNQSTAFITKEEAKENMKVYSKKWNEDNREYRSQVNREYYNVTKDHKSIMGAIHYEENKEEINAKAGEKITCICGRVFRRDSLSKHKKSTIHINYINSL